MELEAFWFQVLTQVFGLSFLGKGLKASKFQAPPPKIIET